VFEPHFVALLHAAEEYTDIDPGDIKEGRGGIVREK
jgi:hypothetical protein